MPVSARTYQIIHSLRVLAQQDKPTTSEALNTLWREKKKQDRVAYDQTYIAPSAQDDLLHRLVLEDGLLSRDGSGYHLTPKGSNLADMIDRLGVDTCTFQFLNDFKAQMTMAALLSSLTNSLTVKEASDRTLLSQDSARRGLNDLLLWGKVTLDKGLYTLVPLPKADPVPVPTTATIVASPIPVAPDPVAAVAAVLDGIDESPMSPIWPPDRAEPFGDEGVGVEPEDHRPCDGDDYDTCMGCPDQGHCPDEGIDEDDDDGDDTDWHDEEVLDSLHETWLTVDPMVQARFFARATTMGITLADYMAILDESFVEAARRTFLPPGEFLCGSGEGCGCGREGEPKKG